MVVVVVIIMVVTRSLVMTMMIIVVRVVRDGECIHEREVDVTFDL